MISIKEFIKKIVEVDGIWGLRSKKASGVQDRKSIFTDTVIFNNATNTLKFTLPLPEWINNEDQDGKAIRIMNERTLNPNGNKKYYITNVIDDYTIEVQPDTQADAIINYTGLTRVSGRIWEVVNNPNICDSDREGNTVFNTHHQEKGAKDGGDISLVHFDHYHGRIITHTMNSAGDSLNIVAMSAGQQVVLPLGPQIVVSNDGKVIIA